MSLRLAVIVAAFHLGEAFPSCNQQDGDYPGCGISKVTHSSSQPRAGKQWMDKYFPVQTPGDECTDDQCDCSATSTHSAWHINQGRVYTTRQISPSGGASPGNGFGLHLVDVPAHLTTGGLTTEQVEAQFASKLGDMSKFDSFMDYNVVFATTGLQAYKNAFTADGVKYLAGTWSDVSGKQYTSIIVNVPGSQLILELVQQGTLIYEEGEAQPVKLEQRVPDVTVLAQEKKLSAREGATGTSGVGSYLVSLVVNRAVSTKSLAKLEGFYVTGMGTKKTHDATENGVSKKCFLWPGASVNICFTNRPDSATIGAWKVGDFEDMLNTVHANIIGGHPWCPMDKWFDNHYAIDSQSLSTSAILSYVNTNKPYHICKSSPMGGNGVGVIIDPTGWGIQMDAGLGLSSDCSSTEMPIPSNNTRRLLGGKYNPACTTDTSKCAMAVMV